MREFTEQEIGYHGEQRLGRPATVNAAGQPHVVPAAFRLVRGAGSSDIGGPDLGRSKKFRGIDPDAFRPNARSVGR